MDACTEPQLQSVSFSEDKVIQKVCVGDILPEDSEIVGSTDGIPLILLTVKEFFSNEPTGPKLPSSPTSTPKEETVYPHTPQTSPPQPTPLKVTLSNTKIANIAHTSSIMSSLTSRYNADRFAQDFAPAFSCESIFSTSQSSMQPSNEKSNSMKTSTESETQRLMSPVKLPLKSLCSMSDSSKTSEPSLKVSPLKRRRDDEIARENASVRSFDSPKKVRHVDAKPQTPNIGNRRYSTVSQPFRPPSSLKNAGNASDPAIVFSSPKTPVPSSLRSEPKRISTKNNQSSSNKLYPKKYHTPTVSKPFKSPFMSPLSSLSSVTNKSTSSPNIQTLEKKVTMLRRAIKLVADKEDEKLKDLVQKWILAGREVSWELWSIMKERGPGDAMAWAEGSRFNDNWSWGTNRNGGSEERTQSADEESSAPLPFEAEMWNSINIQNTMKRQETEDNKVSPHTLGAMLRSYGITNDILEWNDDEEDFDQLK